MPADSGAQWPVRHDPRRHRGRRNESQRALGRATLELARTVGLDAVTVDEIAFAAGLSRRTFFRCFATKDDAIMYRFDDMFARVERDARFALQSGPTWPSLQSACVGSAAAAMQDPAEMRELHRLVDATPGLRLRYLARLDALRGILLELVRSPGGIGNEAELTVHCAVAIMTAAVAWWAASDTAHPAELVRMIIADFARFERVFTLTSPYSPVTRPA